MQNIKITLIVEGLDGLVQAIDNLAGAIQAQEAFVVPVDPPEELKTAAEKIGESKLKTTVSAEQVRAKFVDLARTGARNELKALLAEYGVENVSALDESVLGDVYTKLEEMSCLENTPF